MAPGAKLICSSVARSLSPMDLGLFFAGTVGVVFGAGVAAPRPAALNSSVLASKIGLAIEVASGALHYDLAAVDADTFTAYTSASRTNFIQSSFRHSRVPAGSCSRSTSRHPLAPLTLA